jgi:hypothetical protein
MLFLDRFFQTIGKHGAPTGTVVTNSTMMALVCLHADCCSIMVDCCSVMHHASTPFLCNIICHVQKDGIDQLQVSWHFESQIM